MGSTTGWGAAQPATRSPHNEQHKSITLVPQSNESQETISVDSELGQLLLKVGLSPGENSYGFGPGDALSRVSALGQPELVRKLLDRGTDVNAMSNSGMTGLHQAAFVNDCTTLKVLLDAKADVGARGVHESTPLHVAVEAGRVEAADLLIQHGADPAWESKAFAGCNTLHLAAAMSQTSVLDLLLSANPSLLESTTELGRTPFQVACVMAHLEFAKELLKHGASIRSRDNDGNTSLHLAAKKGAMSCVSFLIEAGVDITARNNDGYTPLLFAVDGKQWDAANLLLDHGADVNDQQSEGWSSLMIASALGTTAIVSTLVSRRANLHLVNKKGLQALHYAAIFNQEEIMEYLVANGADVQARDASQDTPLSLAVGANGFHSVRFLLEHGANVEAQNDRLETALIIAVVKGHCPIARLLLEYGSDIEHATNTDARPLFIAVARDGGNPEMVRLLLEEGANPNAEHTVKRITALHAATATSNIAIIQLLLDFGGDPTMKMSGGETALDMARELDNGDIIHMFSDQATTRRLEQLNIALGIAAEKGHLEQVTQLIDDNGLDVNVRDVNGRTPLSRAGEAGKEAVFDLLIERGARLGLADINGESPLWWASRYGHKRIVDRILASCDDYLIGMGDSDNRTPLMVASQRDHVEIVRLFLQRRVEVDATTVQGMTALHFAARSGHLNSARLLIEHGADTEHKCKLGNTALTWAAGQSADLLQLLETPDSLEQYSFDMLEQQVISDQYSQRFLIDSGSSRQDTRRPYHKQGQSTNPSPYANALLDAVRHNNVASIHRLIKAGAHVDGESIDKSPILYAADLGRDLALIALIQNKADTVVSDQRGYTAMHFAASRGNASIVSELHKAGCPHDSSAEGSVTPLHQAAGAGNLDTVGTLVQLGADINLATDVGLTPLMMAVRQHHTATAELLLDQGANPHSVQNQGLNALAYAIQDNNLEMVKLFFDRGIGGKGVSFMYDTLSPLYQAVEARSELVIKYLLGYGVDVNYPGVSRMTPLMLAARMGSSTMVTMLCEAGADLSCQDDLGRTALAHAKDHMQESIIKLLYTSETPDQTGARKQEQNKVHQKPRYKYRALPSERHIRILYLHPGEARSTISFELNHISLDEKNISYEALSYEWGQKHGTLPVQCGQSTLLITPNCKLALERLRHPAKTRPLWIDALCINQAHDSERNTQVALMSEIFTRSRTVQMWLGEDDERSLVSTKTAFEGVSTLAQVHRQITQGTGSPRVTPEALQAKPQLKEEVDMLATTGKVSTLVSLATRSYFTRTWIVQEILVAGSRGMVIQGANQCSWTDFEAAIRVLHAAGLIERNAEIIEVISTIDSIASSRGLLIHPNDIIDYALTFKATDLRDLIFVSLGLINLVRDLKDHKSPPLPDYRLGPKQVLVRSVRYFVDYARELSFLSYGVQRSRKVVQDLPSWVPDLMHRSNQVGGRIFPDTPITHCVPSPRMATTDTSLYVTGCVLDEVLFTITFGPASDLYSEVIRPMVRTLYGLGFYPHHPYTADRWGDRTYLQAVMDMVGLSGLSHASKLRTESFLIWRLAQDEEDLIVPHCSSSDFLRSGFAQWEDIIRSETLPGFLEIEAHSLMERHIEKDKDLVLTRKGVLGTTDAGEAEPDLAVILLATAEIFLLCDVCHTKRAFDTEREDSRYYRIKNLMYTDHLRKAKDDSPVSLEQVWPGDYQVETLEIQ